MSPVKYPTDSFLPDLTMSGFTKGILKTRNNRLRKGHIKVESTVSYPHFISWNECDTTFLAGAISWGDGD